MAKLYHEISMSLDGFIAVGPRPGELARDPRPVRRPHGPGRRAHEGVVDRSGAVIMGKNMFGPGPGPWGDDPWQGWWGDDPPFHNPCSSSPTTSASRSS